MKFCKLTAIAASVVMLSTMASTVSANDNKIPKPVGFKQVLMFMGTGVFELTDSSPFPGVTGCLGTLCDSDYFYTDIMGFSQSKLARERQDAIDYLNAEFGIDIEQLVAEGRIEFKPYTGNPNSEYRLYNKAGSVLPSDGWIARDGGFVITILDFDGIPLAGNHVGETATVLNQMYYGTYNILSIDSYRVRREIIIDYESNELAVISPDGERVTFNTRTHHKSWGEGQSYVSYEFAVSDSGEVITNGREVMTFDKFSSSTDFPRFPAFDTEGYR